MVNSKPALTDAHKFTLRDRHLRLVLAMQNFNAAKQSLTAAQTEFDKAFNAIVTEFGSEDTYLDLETLAFLPKPLQATTPKT